MIHSKTAVFLSAAFLSVIIPFRVQAQDVKARILVLFDTSGSMTQTLSGAKTDGDGSADPLASGRYCCPGTGDSRLQIAKDAMTQMLNATGDIEFALMKFPQSYDPDQADMVSADWYRYNVAAAVNDEMRYKGVAGVWNAAQSKYDYSGAFSQTSRYLAEPFATDNSAQILSWMNHTEFESSGAPKVSLFESPLTGDYTEQELRGDGGTPLGESISAAYTYLQSVIAADTHPRKACRPYYLVILADGDYDGLMQPVTGDLHGGGTAGKGVDDLRDDLGIETWVIGLATQSTTLDQMADVGGCHYDPNRPKDRTAHADAADDAGCTTTANQSGHAFLANSKQSLSNILYYIISSAVLTEHTCDNADNNCNGEVDEGFDLYCDWNGVTPSSPPTATLCVDPVEDLCDGEDNNCDGEVDEGSWPSKGNCGGGTVNYHVTNYPHTICRLGSIECIPGYGEECVGDVGPESAETCNGLDDDCDGLVDENLANSGNYTLSGDACGTDLGVCTAGVMICTASGWQCNAGTGSAEVCDGVDNDCDGSTDESYPEAGQACYTGGSGCTSDGSGGYNCVGTCRAGVRTCVAGALTCSGQQIPAADDRICDGLNEDCDGSTDENVNATTNPTFGTACPSDATAAAATCAADLSKCPCRAGTITCQGTGGLQCTGTIVRATTEVCDGLDNNCNGTKDESLFGSCGGCIGAGCTADPGEGECRVGTASCNATTSTPGNPVYDVGCTDIKPVQEVCDGKDNDCDGLTDAADPSMTAVSGACYLSGQTGCTETTPGVFSCVGACKAGTLSCSDGRETCSGATLPVSEGAVCDDVDNNCNGSIDEGITNACGPTIDTVTYPGAAYGVGACAMGIQFCNPTGTGWGTCTGARGPGPELCNGIDDDCDGDYEDAENADLLANASSYVGNDCGTCSGKYACVENTDVVATYPLTADVPGAYELECQGGSVEVETCDGTDQNCNNLIDDGIAPVVCGGCLSADYPTFSCIPASAGEGECETGLSYCEQDPVNGAGFSVCYGSVGPVLEVCDGLDNDCDGTADNGLSQIGVECQAAQGACSGGVYECWTDLDTFETSLQCCDADELLLSGACVSPTLPSLEVCDGLDNDCDGLTDGDDGDLGTVGLPCGSSLGECSPGVFSCQDSDTDSDYEIVCAGETQGSGEVCDNLDNDCDGLTDEEIPAGADCCNAPGWMADAGLQQEYPDCIGVCGMGQMVCVSGEMACNATNPGTEVCDGLDNDCDGATDETLEVECPVEGSTCEEGQCAEPCVNGEFSCPGGKECILADKEKDVWLCLSSLCDPKSNDALPCVFNSYVCSDGYAPPCTCDTLSKSCVDRCYGVTCPENTYCVARDYGRCHPVTEGCTVTGCGENEICADKGAGCTDGVCQECVADPCAGVACAQGKYCNAKGKCVGTCADVECPAGSGCREGKCVDDACAGVFCKPGIVCNPETGKCDGSLSNPCFGVSCEYYEICDAGECAFDPCWNIECPSGLMCHEGSCYVPPGSTTADTDSGADTETTGEDTSSEADTDTESVMVDTDSEDVDTDSDTVPSDYKGIDNVLVTGVGGCLCSGTPGAPETSGGGWLLMLGALVLLVLRRAVRDAWNGHRLLTNTARQALGPWMLLVLGVLVLGCQVEPYSFNDGADTGSVDTSSGGGTDTGTSDTETDTSSGGDADTDADTDTTTDTAAALCAASDAGPCKATETCCVNQNGVPLCVDLSTSVAHCGECNNGCAISNASAVCNAGECALGACEAFWNDRDSDAGNGCEEFCQPTVDPADNADRCDGVATSADTDNGYTAKDNDCDGEFDEDVGFSSNTLHCGWCGNVCQFDHALASCEAGQCERGACHDNWYDLDTDTANDAEGCDYYCVGDPADEEVCNARDDDCNGLVDNEESYPLSGTGGACYPTTASNTECPAPYDNCRGICEAGTLECTASGQIACTGYTLPQKEVCDGANNACCDGLDNNCNNVVDEGGAQVCGGCVGAGLGCTTDPNEGLCAQGLALCNSGASSPGNPVYSSTCTGTVGPAPERCDGYDNDCDGLTDELAADDRNDNNITLNDTQLGSACGLGECAVNRQICSAGKIVCEGNYTAVAEVPCNGKDDDCDGIEDEISSYSCGGSEGVTCADAGGCDPHSEGQCQAGTMTCAGTTLVCTGDIKPLLWTDSATDGCTAAGHCDTCDGIDNDCDGVTDEDAFYYDSNTVCGEPCAVGVRQCLNGVMTCTGDVTAKGPDLCNGTNNGTTEDCDAGTPDGSGDPQYLQACDGPDAGACVEGFWQCAGGVKSCNEDTDADVESACDGVDNDCDGSTDEALTAPTPAAAGCLVACPGTEQVVCMGTAGWQCRYQSGSGVECADTPSGGYCATPRTAETLCDGFDGDCDGTADDNFLLQTDVLNCGTCGTNCNTKAGWTNPTSVSTVYCGAGTCKVQKCATGFINANQIDTDGCECVPNTATSGVERCDTVGSRGRDDDCNGVVDEIAMPEVCDGVDNDCDGLTDLADPGLTTAAAPSWICNTDCPGTTQIVCNGASGWGCNYDTALVQLSAGQPVAAETWCDGVDNDCDGTVDEGPGIVNADYLGQACSNDPDSIATNGPFGVCLRNGTMACAPTKTDAPICCNSNETICSTGAVPLPGTLAGAEIGPNGLDEDCDGLADDGLDTCANATSLITYTASSVNYDFEIFAFEASRYDATNATSGTVSTVACSNNLVIPWTALSQEEAAAACANLNPDGNPAGAWQLCSAAQWEMACEMGGGMETLYPYGDTYVDDTCNGADFSNNLLMTEGMSGCFSDWDVDTFDMSGNAEEWTATENATGSGLYQIRGGSYNDQAGGLTCEFDFWAAESTGFRMPNLGFRCCNGDDPADLCASITCNSPPANQCVGDVLRKYSTSGTCDKGACQYTYTDYTCPQGTGCVVVGTTPYCDRDNRAELWYSASTNFVHIDIDERTGVVQNTHVSVIDNFTGCSAIPGHPCFLPQGQNCITVLDDGSILGARLGKENQAPFVNLRTYFYYVPNPPRDGSAVVWRYFGEMAGGIKLEGLYTDCNGRIYGMDTGVDDGGAAGNRLIRFNDGLPELQDGSFNINDFIVISDLATAVVGDIDDLGPGINAQGQITDNPGFAIDTGQIWSFNYQTGSGAQIGTGGSWGIHVLGSDLYVDSLSRVYVLDSNANLRSWNHLTNTLSGILYQGPVTAEGNRGWSGLAGPLTECQTGFSI